MSEPVVLGIESTCDETAAAIVRGRELLSNVVASSMEEHARYGGVIPEIASRAHAEAFVPCVSKALVDANMTLADVDAIAVSAGPGLAGCLAVGVSGAKALAWAANKPIYGINHVIGHIAVTQLQFGPFPKDTLALIVSGGHTSLLAVPDYETFRTIGQTRDDAAGEAFDKVARVMGLPYPGGPQIDRLAKEGNPQAIDFPRALQEKGNYEFSFSGLKSAVLNYLNSMKLKGQEVNKADVAASFQDAVIEVLIAKAMEALEQTKMDTLVLAGGVAANSALESRLRAAAEARGVKFYYPSHILCTDNAAMIGCRAYYQGQAGGYSDLYLNAVPGLKLQDVAAKA